jgi:hypothetical protein
MMKREVCRCRDAASVVSQGRRYQNGWQTRASATAGHKAAASEGRQLLWVIMFGLTDRVGAGYWLPARTTDMFGDSGYMAGRGPLSRQSADPGSVPLLA